ncbi:MULTISPECIES: HsdM family class I SAM-dependent methyltransferase [Cupriavidus]|uniref:site-specific DNA-methyltransferase (adenine-specific) n=2 Tax=Cupriavidus TaxID=106589 RepID=A0A7M2HAL9_9BURK|nr:MULTISPECIES: N-6 DNA methylase [Cupriavidus]QOT81587.1 N-6 DNA methylase [Cupriavidus basilensis]
MGQVLARAGHTSDPWGRYYTTPIVSQSLVDRIEVAKPKLVLELGSGSGSLCTAAATRWHKAQLVTVDVDSRAPKALDADMVGTGRRHSHYVHDVLDAALSDKIGLAPGTVDVAVCNPPYIRPKWRSDFGKILEDAGLSGTLASLHDAGADLLFLAQNLRLLRKNGKLGLILPDGLITAERFSGVRKTLLRQHLIEQVVQLPRGVFKGTEAQTYLAVLSKSAGETNQVTLRQMDSDGQLSVPIEILQEAAVKRLDFTFHARVVSPQRSGEGPMRMSVRQALTDVVRGTVCSSSISAFPAPVFHLGDFSEPLGEHAVRVVPKRFALSERKAQQMLEEARLALPGDILLARVGRSLEDRLALVVHGPCVISDCIFALRAMDEHRERLYRFFDSDLGRHALASSAHGVAARFMSKTNLFEIQF